MAALDGQQMDSLALAAEHASKVDALLVAKGKYKPKTNAQIASHSRTEQSLFTVAHKNYNDAEVEINDAPRICRDILTRNAKQEMISKRTGAFITTKGRYMSIEDRNDPSLYKERPLYLYVRAETETSVERAVAEINNIIASNGGSICINHSNSQTAGPLANQQTNIPNSSLPAFNRPTSTMVPSPRPTSTMVPSPSSSSIFNSINTAIPPPGLISTAVPPPKLVGVPPPLGVLPLTEVALPALRNPALPTNTALPPPGLLEPVLSAGSNGQGDGTPQFIEEKFYIGLEHAPPSFDVRSKVSGENGSFLQHIHKESGAVVTLRGRGSGYLDMVTKRESTEPMHIHLKHLTTSGLENAKKMANDLIKTVQEEYSEFQRQLALQPPVLSGSLFANYGITTPASLPPPNVMTSLPSVVRMRRTDAVVTNQPFSVVVTQQIPTNLVYSGQPMTVYSQTPLTLTSSSGFPGLSSRAPQSGPRCAVGYNSLGSQAVELVYSPASVTQALPPPNIEMLPTNPMVAAAHNVVHQSINQPFTLAVTQPANPVSFSMAQQPPIMSINVPPPSSEPSSAVVLVSHAVTSSAAGMALSTVPGSESQPQQYQQVHLPQMMPQRPPAPEHVTLAIVQKPPIVHIEQPASQPLAPSQIAGIMNTATSQAQLQLQVDEFGQVQAARQVETVVRQMIQPQMDTAAPPPQGYEGTNLVQTEQQPYDTAASVMQHQINQSTHPIQYNQVQSAAPGSQQIRTSDSHAPHVNLVHVQSQATPLQQYKISSHQTVSRMGSVPSSDQHRYNIVQVHSQAESAQQFDYQKQGVASQSQLHHVNVVQVVTQGNIIHSYELQPGVQTQPQTINPEPASVMMQQARPPTQLFVQQPQLQNVQFIPQSEIAAQPPGSSQADMQHQPMDTQNGRGPRSTIDTRPPPPPALPHSRAVDPRDGQLQKDHGYRHSAGRPYPIIHRDKPVSSVTAEHLKSHPHRNAVNRYTAPPPGSQ